MTLRNKWFVFALSLALACGIAGVADASVADYLDRSLHKLGRGLHDTVFCLGEIPYQVAQTHEMYGVYGAATSGILIGLGRTVVRAVVGVFEIGTFLIPQEPVLEPEFFFAEIR